MPVAPPAPPPAAPIIRPPVRPVPISRMITPAPAPGRHAEIEADEHARIGWLRRERGHGAQAEHGDEHGRKASGPWALGQKRHVFPPLVTATAGSPLDY